MGLGRSKPESNTQKLDRLVEAINSMEDRRVSLQERKTVWVEYLITYGLGLYFLLGGLVYVLGGTITRGRASLVCYALYPILLFVIREVIIWMFDQRLKSALLRLDSLRAEKKRVMETIMRTETYRTLRACLERVDGEESPKSANSNTMPPPKPTPLRPLALPPSQTMPPRKTLIHSFVDRVLEFVAGEGLNHRFALICSQCSSHNGLALREEYDYLSFRCFNCRHFNPARKLRPIAPRLGVNPIGTENDDYTDEENEKRGGGRGRDLARKPILTGQSLEGKVT